MGFGEAVKTVFGKYATMQGRASRGEFWWWVVFLFILQVVSNLVDRIFGLDTGFKPSGAFGVNLGNLGWLSLIVAIVLIIPTIEVSVRRLHDTDRSGWWWWINIICCIGGIILLIFYVSPSTPGDNRFGPQPR